MRGWLLVYLAVPQLVVQTACYHVQAYDGGIVSRKTLAKEKVSQQVHPPELEVFEADIVEAEFVGRIRSAAQCQDVEQRTMEVTRVRKYAFVDDNGNEGNPAKAGGILLGIGASVPVWMPIAVWLVNEQERAECNCDVPGTELFTDDYWLATVLTGGAIAAVGLGYLIFSGTKPEKEYTTQFVRAHKLSQDESYPCQIETISPQAATLRVGTSSLSATIAQGGQFKVSLQPLALSELVPLEHWELVLADKRRVWVPVVREEVFRLLEQLKNRAYQEQKKPRKASAPPS